MSTELKGSRQGSVIGTILLIGGSCIGAGMLGLPLSSAMTGFWPSTLMFILTCLFMVSTGVLLLETTLYFKGEVNLISMADRTLGKGAKRAVFALFIFLFYSLIVAYSAGSGALFADFCEQILGARPGEWVGGALFNLLFGFLVFMGTGAVDRVNRLLMGGLIISYLGLVYLGIEFVDPDKLKAANWNNALWTLPVMVISFGYHNLVPSLSRYLGHDARRIQLAIFVGCLVPLTAYLLWDYLILGIIPLERFKEAAEGGRMVTHSFREAVGTASVVQIAEYFAFFAIVTSFIGVALSFVDFLSDAFQVKKSPSSRFLITLLALAPPYIFSLVYPKIFLMALDAAGGFGAVILFGIIPALMVWSGRYRKKLWEKPLLPFGRLGLVLVMLFSLVVFLVELVSAVQGRGF